MTLPAIPIAWGWANLPMLAWLAAVAVPIAIHLWSRRRFREVPWAAMRYLLAAARKNRRRLLIERYGLLALRVLLIALVALAAAEPYLERHPFQPAPGERTHRVLVIDGSYSMAYRPTDQSRFERAKQVAAQIIERSAQGDGFTLVLMASPPRVVVGRAAFESGMFLQEIDQLPQTHSAADLRQTLALVQGLIDTVRREQPRLSRHEVYFLTDLGRVGWGAEGYGSQAGELQRRAAQLAEVAHLVVIDLGQVKTENAAIVELRASQSLITLPERVPLTAQVKNFGSGPVRRSVELFLDGRRIQQQVVELEPGQQRPVRFSAQFDTAGDHALEARLESDALELDNHRWLALTVRQSVGVLCVEGRPDGAGEGSTFFLRRALAPSLNDAVQAVQPEVVPESALLERDLSAYQCVYLSNVAQFTPAEAQVLGQYLGAGGNLVFFLGDRVLADRYNRQLTGQGGAPPILPATLGEIVEKPQGLDPLGYQHPAVRVFRGQENSGLLTTPVRKYFRLAVPRSSAAQVVLALADGEPLVVEQAVGRGRVVLVATAADASWSQWPRWPSFVPFVHELLAYGLGARQQQRNLQVGQTLEGVPPAPADQTPLRVTRPDGSRETLRGSAGLNAWSYTETAWSGIYAVGLDSPATASELFAVNLDTAESDLARVDPDELRRTVWSGVPWQYETSWENPVQAVAHAGRAGSALPVWLLYAVLALMLAETYIAWRQGEARS